MATKPVGGLGSGTPQQELERWLRDSRRIHCIDEGEQGSLFQPEPVRMYRLMNEKGDSKLITAELAHRYGYHPRPIRAATPQQSMYLYEAPTLSLLDLDAEPEAL